MKKTARARFARELTAEVQISLVLAFGDLEEECWIKNKRTNKNIPMKKRKVSYVIEVEFVVRKPSIAPIFIGQS